MKGGYVPPFYLLKGKTMSNEDIKKIFFINKYEGTRDSLFEIVTDCTHVSPLMWDVDYFDGITEEVGIIRFTDPEDNAILVCPGDHVLIGILDDDEDDVEMIIRVIKDEDEAKKINRKMITEFVIDKIIDDDSDDVDKDFINALVDRFMNEQNDKDDPGHSKCEECDDDCISLCLISMLHDKEFDAARELIDILEKKED